MLTIKQVKESIVGDQDNWLIYLMNFVDDFRRSKDVRMVKDPLTGNHDRYDALLSSVVHYLCDELNLDVPEWIYQIPACKDPWFVNGIENLKAISLVESPIQFRVRKIFVLENFLSRV